MPNHYHLFIRANGDGLSRSMQAMLLAYTKRINNAYGRTGSVFQGRFKAVLVDREAHWRYLTVYIYRNPVEAGLARAPQDWPYSSYREFVGLRGGTLVRPFQVWEGSPGAYRRLVEGFGPAERESIEEYAIE